MTLTHTQRADYFEHQALAHQRIADSEGYRGNPEARAAELAEVGHYFTLAALYRTNEVSVGNL